MPPHSAWATRNDVVHRFAPGFLATLVFAAFGWRLSTPYIAKQAARAMCAFEGAPLPHTLTPTSNCCTTAQDRFEITRSYTVDDWGPQGRLVKRTQTADPIYVTITDRISAPALNTTLAWLYRTDPSRKTEDFLIFYIQAICVALVACAMCLFWGLYILNRRLFSPAQSAVLSAGLVGLHAAVFLLSTVVL